MGCTWHDPVDRRLTNTAVGDSMLIHVFPRPALPRPASPLGAALDPASGHVLLPDFGAVPLGVVHCGRGNFSPSKAFTGSHLGSDETRYPLVKTLGSPLHLWWRLVKAGSQTDLVA